MQLGHWPPEDEPYLVAMYAFGDVLEDTDRSAPERAMGRHQSSGWSHSQHIIVLLHMSDNIVTLTGGDDILFDGDRARLEPSRPAKLGNARPLLLCQRPGPALGEEGAVRHPGFPYS